jgi:hypothetical protein
MELLAVTVKSPRKLHLRGITTVIVLLMFSDVRAPAETRKSKVVATKSLIVERRKKMKE